MTASTNHGSYSELRAILASLEDKGYPLAHSLPGVFYTDPGWAKIECDELFARHWFCVGRADEIERRGDFFTFDQVGEPILVVHGRDGVIRAFANICRHRGTVVATGRGNTRIFRCPYHHWVYDTAGRLLNAPQLETRESFDLQQCRLPELKCELWQGFVFVNLDPQVSALRTRLATLTDLIGNYHLEQMRQHYLADEIWDINWKCLLENFMEGYHLTPLHQSTLHQLNPSRLCNHLTPGDYHFGYSVGFAQRLIEQRLGHPDLTEEELETCIMLALPPGLAIGIGSDYSSYLCIRPLAAAQVNVKMGLIFYGDSWLPADIDHAIDLFRRTMQEDKQILLRLQQGLASRLHQPGPLAGRNLEGTIWDFYQYLSRSLGRGKNGPNH